MKLTKPQVEALARKLADEENEKIRLKNKRIENSSALKAAMHFVKKEINKISPDIVAVIFSSYRSKDDIIKSVALKRLGLKIECENVSSWNYMGKINVASIDASTMTELMERLKEQNA